jgi:Glycosyl hydrolase family 76
MRRRVRRAVLAAVAATGLLGLPAQAHAQGTPAPSFAAAAQRGMQELLGSGDHSPVSWNSKTGLWGGHMPANWWQSALAVSTIVRYAERTGGGSPVYQRVLERVYKRNVGSRARPKFTNQFMDDTAWWGLAWLDAAQYELYYRGNRRDAARFLAVAEYDGRYIAAQPRPCGGIPWGIGFPPDAVANAQFIALAARLYRVLSAPGPFHASGHAARWLNDAQAALGWLEDSGMINLRAGMVYDSLDRRCRVTGGALTYTQGEVAEALVQTGLALGDPGYADQASAFLTWAVGPDSGLTANGILQERCEAIPGRCAQQRFRRDLPAYKGLLVDALSDWESATRRSDFDAFLRAQAAAVLANAIRGPGNRPGHCANPRGCQFAFSWTGRPDPAPIGVTLGGQESALDALVAVLPKGS